MSERKLLPALSRDALYEKSRLYIRKALERKEHSDLDEYQLWASLALELVGKAVLAGIHPSLIVDPTHSQSVFAASGINLSTDIKTISAHTLFERLRHCTHKFDDKAKTFCVGIAQRRNTELHSGETPFRTMRTEAWEAQYWHAAQIILGAINVTLDEWLGASQAETPKALLKHARQAGIQAVHVRVERAKETFNGRKKSDRDRALKEASGKSPLHYGTLFDLVGDKEWSVECPACGGKAFVAGFQIEEEVTDTYADEDGAWESVERHYAAEEFHCPVCDLVLQGTDELEAADVTTDHSETDEREMEYGPEYGND